MNSERRRQIGISYAILGLITLTLILLVVAPPIKRRIELADHMESSRDLYRRARLAIAEGAAAIADESTGIDEALLLHADTDALAAAELQQTIAAIVSAEGASLVSTAFRRTGENNALVEVPVAVRLRSSVESLVAILQAIERNRPRLFVADLSIQSRHSPGRSLRDVQEELDVQFDVIGYLLPAGELP